MIQTPAMSQFEALQPETSPLRPKPKPSGRPTHQSPFAPQPEPEPLPFPCAAHLRRPPRAFPSPELLAKIVERVGPPSQEELKALRDAQAEVKRLIDEELRWGIDEMDRAYYGQRTLAEAAIARGERPPESRTFDEIQSDFSTKRESAHLLRTKFMERSWDEIVVPLLKRFLDGAQRLIPELEKMGSKVNAELGIANPSRDSVLAIRELGAFLSWMSGPMMNLESLPFIGGFLK